MLIVSIDDPVPPEARATGLGLKVPLVLLGRPLTLKLTLPLKLLTEFRFTVYEVLFGLTTLWLEGVTLRLKSGTFGSGVAVGGTGVGVLVGIGTGVLVGVGCGPAAHPGNLNEPMRVTQGAPPVLARYSVVNQKVQSSAGSTCIAE